MLGCWVKFAVVWLSTVQFLVALDSEAQALLSSVGA